MPRPAAFAIPLAILVSGLLLQPALAAPQWGGRMRLEAPRENRGAPRAPAFPAPPRPPAAVPRGQAPSPPLPQRQPPPQISRPEFPPPRPSLSPGEAAQRAQQINGGGRVLAVEPAENGYRVRVLKNGEVRSVFVPGG